MGRKVRDTEFFESAYMNNRTFQQYYQRLTELSVSMFDWKNVPETIDVRYLELCLFGKGQVVFFKDNEIGYLALPCITTGGFNVYNIPLKREALANNGYHADLNIDNSVIIYNNYLRTPSKLDVEMFSKRLYNLDRAIDVNANAQKTPILIQCDENQRLTMKNVYKEYEGNAPVIFGNKALNTESIKVLKTDAPYVADKLYTLKTQIWNEALTYLGINNVNISKKERLITDEVSRNMGGVIASRYSRLEARRTAADQINKMFGLNISVDYREDYRELEDAETDTENSDKGDNENGNK